jgi:hypothetical protein
VLDTPHAESRFFGINEDLRFDAIHQMSQHVGGDLPADVNDEASDQEASDTVSPPQARGHADEPAQSAGGGDGVEPGMLGIGQEGVGLNAGTNPLLVSGNNLIPDDANSGGRHAKTEVCGAPMMNELVDAHDPGEDGAGPDDDRYTKAGHVLGSLVAIRM